MQWKNPQYLHFLPAIAVGWIALCLYLRRFYQNTSARLGAQRLPHFLPGFSWWRAALSWGLYGLGLACLLLALSRPQWGFREQEVPEEGSEVLIAVDVSNSMRATDIAPNRLEAAKRAILDFVKQTTGDRIGIAVFAGKAFLLAPPTNDADALALFVDLLEPGLVPFQGTNLAGAISLAIDSFNPQSSPESRAILLMTDGEDHGDALDQAIETATEKNIPVFIVGIGTPEGAPIPLEAGGFKTDVSGGMVRSRLDSARLADIAQKTHGRFLEATHSVIDLASFYRREIGSSLEKSPFDSHKHRIYHERFAIPLAIGLFLLALAPLARFKKTRLRPSTGIALILAGLFSFSQSAAAKDPALDRYRDGNAAYEAQDFARAKTDYEAALSKKNPNDPTAKRALFNLGNSAYRSGDLKSALEAYETLLSVDPQNRAAQLNRDFVKKKQEQEDSQGEAGESQEQNGDGGSQSEDSKNAPGSPSSEDKKPSDKEQNSQTKPNSEGKENSDSQTNNSEKTGDQPKEDAKTKSEAAESEKDAEKRRALRWLDSISEENSEVVGKQIERELPNSGEPEKDW